MYTSRLFWKLLAACGGITLAAVFVAGLLLASWQRERTVRQADERLREAAAILAGSLEQGAWSGEAGEDSDGAPLVAPRSLLQQRVRELGKQTGLRITLVSRGGEVLADSTQESVDDVAAMENHRSRPEIALALAGGEGMVVRASAAGEQMYRYFAARVDGDGGAVGVVRTALAESVVEAEVAEVRRLLGMVGAVVFLFVMVGAYAAVGHVVGPVATLQEATEAIAAGDYQHRVYVPNRDELGELAHLLNRMTQDLQGRMADLRESHDRHATALGGMIEGVIAVDGRERIVLANQAAGRLFDFRPQAVEGRPLLEVVRDHALHQAVSAALATGRPQRLESTEHGARSREPTAARGPEASDDAGSPPVVPRSVLTADVQVTPLPGNPCPGVVLVMHDTTELRRLESLRRDFVANVSHELKTPLSSIKAYAETLRGGALADPEASQRFLMRIDEQTDRLHHLIQDMLMLARIESEQQPFEIVSIEVAEVASACVEDHQALAAAKQITLEIEPGQPPGRVRADREGLREILDNLLDNAIKYTPSGGRVALRWRRVEETIQIEVEDTGIGIGPEDRRRVFERFYRVDKARSREMGGTGLGLSIVKHLVQSFGGRVGVESGPSRGSRFWVRLPLA